MDKVRKLMLPTWRVIRTNRYYSSEQQLKNLVTFPDITISQGKLKYIIAKVFVNGEMGQQSKIVIRGRPNVKYHFDVYEQLEREANELNLSAECMGGGQMVHDNDNNYIKLYGRSRRLGKADHDVTKKVLSANTDFSAYKIDSDSVAQDTE